MKTSLAVLGIVSGLGGTAMAERSVWYAAVGVQPAPVVAVAPGVRFVRVVQPAQVVVTQPACVTAPVTVAPAPVVVYQTPVCVAPPPPIYVRPAFSIGLGFGSFFGSAYHGYYGHHGHHGHRGHHGHHAHHAHHGHGGHHGHDR